MSESVTQIDKGMAGVVAAETLLSDVRGDIGELIYCGYNIDELAENATFEEVVHLLHRGHLPNGKELTALKAELSAARAIPAGLVDVLKGLPKETALRAVTLSPAEIFGAGDRLGSIEIGKSATLIVTSGDPLEITTDTLMAFIDGRRIDLGTRQKSLYAKYQQKYRQLGLID